LEFQILINCFFYKGKKRKRSKKEQEKQNTENGLYETKLEMKNEEVDKTEKQKKRKRHKIDNTQTQNNSTSSELNLNPNSKLSEEPNNQIQLRQDDENVSEDILPEVVSFHQAKAIATQQRREELQALKRSRMRGLLFLFFSC
jgi:hypothetical protein